MFKRIQRLLSVLLACLLLILPIRPVHAYGEEDIKVLEEFSFELPEGLSRNIQYDRYVAHDHYFVALKSAQIKKLPTDNSETIDSISSGTKVRAEARVQGEDGENWLRLRLDENTVGYVNEKQGSYRFFDYKKAYERIQLMEGIADDPFTTMIDNYKNVHGTAPSLANGKATDERGYPNDQSAAAYPEPEVKNAEAYLPDGLILVRYESFNGMTRVYSPTWDKFFWVQDKYLVKGDVLRSLTQVFVVDAANQNTIAFEKNDQGQWEVISLSFVSTGATYEGARPTPEGDYRVIVTRPKFIYDNDEDKIYDGYAMYTTRFSCGAYLHGMPASYKYNPLTDGGLETLPDTSPEGSPNALGVKPQSHMCVRNFTSYAKFMFDRVRIGESMVLVLGAYGA